MSNTNQEVVHQGWLIKSPPAKRIFRARWRRRYFALRHSGELPGQYFLEYYKDRNCRKPKGIIDLDKCEEVRKVEAGLSLENQKLKYQFMFTVKIPARTYYLVADSEEDMNVWVEYICHVCSLKIFHNEEVENAPASEPVNVTNVPENTSAPQSPPISPASTNSNYILMSQCISGGSLLNTSFSEQSRAKSSLGSPASNPTNKNLFMNSLYGSSLDSQFYDSPRKHRIPLDNHTVHASETTPSTSRAKVSGHSSSDSDSVFTDEESMKSENATPGIIKCSSSKSKKHRSTLVNSVSMEKQEWLGSLTISGDQGNDAPPRPPKPLQLSSDLGAAGSSYQNLEKYSIAERRALKKKTVLARKSSNTQVPDSPDKPINDDWYDFPRSHQIGNSSTTKERVTTRHCYNNAAPSNVDGHVFRYDETSPHEPNKSQVFHYEGIEDEITTDEPPSPCSQSSYSTTATYSNLSSPLLEPSNTQPAVTPPVVNRDLKPGRALSDSVSIHSTDQTPPVIIRKFKPVLQQRHVANLDSNQGYGTTIQKAAPSPTPLRLNESFHENHGNDQGCSRNSSNDELQYLDLDLKKEDSIDPVQTQQAVPGIIYNSVDFVKTKAFNRTKQRVELERKQLPMDL